MTVKSNCGKFDICTECGANLDPGEKCDCEGETQRQDKLADSKAE